MQARACFVTHPDLTPCRFAAVPAVPAEPGRSRNLPTWRRPRCAHTTGEQRKPWVAQYWDAADPLAIDGPGGESFAALMWCVSSTLDRLAELPLVSVALFGHGQFMQALRWSIAHQSGANDGERLSSVAWRAPWSG